VNRWAPPLLVAAAVVVMLAGMSGRLMPHEWFGISTADLLGYLILLAPVAGLLAVGIVVWDRQRQLLHRWGNHERRIARLEGGRRQRRSTVVRGPWEGSG
jgi:hypothetical protein